MNDQTDDEPSPLKSQSRFHSTFKAFEIPNYRWFFASLFGNFASMNIQMFVRGWLVFEITGSYEKLGWMTAAGGIVGLFAAPLGGVVADRIRQKIHVIQLGGICNFLITLAVAWLIAGNHLIFEHLLIAAVCQGIVMNLMMPSRQALTKDVVGLNLLTNAIALSTSGMNVARLLLPGLAGGLIAALGGGNDNIEPAKWIYLIMAILYLFNTLGMFMVKVADNPQSDIEHKSVMTELGLGFKYVWDTPVILMLLGFNFLMVFFSMTYFMLLPGFVKEVLNQGPDGLGLIISISGIGALAGSLLVASLPNKRRARVLLYGAFIMGIALLGFAISTYFWTSVILLTFVGLGQAARMSLSNILLQAYVEDEFRGRVMSIYMLEMAFLAIAIYPVSLFAEYFGPQWAIGLSAACLIVLTLFLASIPAYRNLD
ncbi:MAG: MFS transporter [Gammaproteobacteria bacterium]|jgi:MFS family permease|nr:MFS transporter [Gammaproteobacteria bacterium]MBT4495040.1 MFS transporter [Gammaproteobacteria bacterium]MBT7371897.1 MFS transporter [Gammaproteobacteria bacterium]